MQRYGLIVISLHFNRNFNLYKIYIISMNNKGGYSYNKILTKTNLRPYMKGCMNYGKHEFHSHQTG